MSQTTAVKAVPAGPGAPSPERRIRLRSFDSGAFGALGGSFEQVGLAMLVSVPLGVMSAVFLNEIGGWMARPLRTIVDAMSAIPSILAGLFIYASFILGLHQQFSGFAAALALSVLML